MIIEVIRAIYDRNTGRLDVVLSDGHRRVYVANAENIERNVLLRDFYKLAQWQQTNVQNL